MSDELFIAGRRSGKTAASEVVNRYLEIERYGRAYLRYQLGLRSRPSASGLGYVDKEAVQSFVDEFLKR